MTTEPPVRFIHAPDLGRPVGYSHAAEVTGGCTVYISGQIALDRHGNVVGADNFEAQARQVFRNLGTVLVAAGLDFSAVVKLTIFLTGMHDIDIAAFRWVRDEFVDTAAPREQRRPGRGPRASGTAGRGRGHCRGPLSGRYAASQCGGDWR